MPGAATAGFAMHQPQFGPYRVLRLLGQGGMGTVYEAVDPAGGGSVAVKTLPLHLAADEGIRRRFQMEIATLLNLRHPGIARMIGFGEENGLPFFVMEFVPGRTLEELLKSGRRFTWRETVAITQEILAPLKSAHDQGVVHRDLKPANLMFPPAPGGGFHVKLTDFGIAKLFGETGLTRSGIVVGTPEYMAPEQATGLVVDHRADLYSLGLVMFAMLAGRPPFQGAIAEVVEAQRTRRPPRVATVVPELPPVLDELIDTLLAKTPESRPPNAAAVARQLAVIATQPAPAADPPRAAASPTAGGTRIEGVTPSALADDLPPTRAMRPPPAAGHRPTGLGQAITVAAESVPPPDGGWSPGDAGHRGPPPGAGSRFTTVEDHRARARDAEQRGLWARTAAAIALIVAILLAGWWLVLQPMLRPDPQRAFDEIIEMLSDPDDLRNPCDAIEGFLTRHPRDPRAAAVRGLGRERALQMLQRRSFKRLPSYKPKSPAEGLYLEAIRAADPRETAAKLRGLLATVPARDEAAGQSAAATDPCSMVEHPDDAMWRELAARQLDIVAAQVEQEDRVRRQHAVTAQERATAILGQAAAFERQAEQAHAAGDAARRVVAITRRHQLLQELVETFDAEPAAAAEVAEARRLLAE